MDKIHYHSDAIDTMKGIGIILVVLGHTIHTPPWHDLIYSFHMPLFFMVAGLFLKPGKNVYLKRLKTLLVPYFVFAVISYIYWRFFEMRFRPIEEGLDPNKHFFDIFWQTHRFNFNVVLWFLPCLLLAIMLANTIFMYIKNKLIIAVLCIIWVTVVSFYIPGMESMWIKEMLYAFPFVTIGFLLHSRFPIIDSYLKDVPIYKKIFSFIPLLIVMLIPHGGDMHNSSYPNGYTFFLVCAVICVISIYVLSTTLTSQKWLSWLGRNTLVIMCLHEPLKRIVIKIFAIAMNQDTDTIRESIILGIIITFIVILSLVPICNLINKRFPCLLGKYKE